MDPTPRLNRRGFLAVLGSAAAAALVLDPERLLWVPGARTFFLPPDKAVVGAAVGDVEALLAGLGGPFVMGVRARGRELEFLVSEAQTPDVLVRHLSDEAYRLLVDRGRKILAARRAIVLTDGTST